MAREGREGEGGGEEEELSRKAELMNRALR